MIPDGYEKCSVDEMTGVVFPDGRVFTKHGQSFDVEGFTNKVACIRVQFDKWVRIAMEDLNDLGITPIKKVDPIKETFETEVMLYPDAQCRICLPDNSQFKVGQKVRVTIEEIQ